MNKKVVFYGQTTFVDKARDAVIQNFQNTYIAGDGSGADKVNSEIKELVAVILRSKDLRKEDKEESVQALHGVAEQVRGQKGSKLTLKDALQRVQEVTAKAADIAAPALGIITTVLKALGLK